MRVISLLPVLNIQPVSEPWFHRQEGFFRYVYTQLRKIYVNIHVFEVVYSLIGIYLGLRLTFKKLI
jgi:hypothetical protein